MIDAILCADVHLRSDVPRSRIDDFTRAMKNKFEFILKLGQKHRCPILIAGDIGHRPTWPWPLYSWFIQIIKKYDADIVCIPGQHDLPNHKIGKLNKAPLGISDMADIITVLNTTHTPGKKIDIYGFPFGSKITAPEYNIRRNIAMIHQMVIEDKPEWEGQITSRSKTLLRENNYDLILSGDNHKSFVVERRGRLLVNPGSMMRSNSDQANHKPRIYLYSSQSNSVEPVYLPIEQDVFKESDKDAENRNNRFEAFIQNLQEDKLSTINFQNNVKHHFETNRTRKNVKERVWEIITND